ncbi:hypothetical protein ScalyP_jg10567 [Parmales sp. scaly parma]|nr:hypothetical protein ScalyP_jg10567 [Parmales sp. scaly parma]
MSCRRAFSVLRRHLVPPNKNERPVPVVLAFSKLSNLSNNNNLSQLESALKSSFVDNSDIELSIIEIDSSKDLLETLTTLTKQTPPVLISVDMKILAGLKFLESRPLDGFVAITPPDFNNRNDVGVGKLERPVCDLLVFSSNERSKSLHNFYSQGQNQNQCSLQVEIETDISSTVDIILEWYNERF